MKTFTTIIQAVDPMDGILKEWLGPYIQAQNIDQAINYCRNNIGYCKVDGELIAEVDEETGIIIDFDNLN